VVTLVGQIDRELLKQLSVQLISSEDRRQASIYTWLGRDCVSVTIEFAVLIDSSGRHDDARRKFLGQRTTAYSTALTSLAVKE